MSTTLTLNEVSKGIQDPNNGESKLVLEGMLNDHMDLLYGLNTPYTTGQRVLPKEVSIQVLESAICNSSTEKKFKDAFVKIKEVYEKGDLTPQSTNDGTWDPKFKPVLVLITKNP